VLRMAQETKTKEVDQDQRQTDADAAKEEEEQLSVRKRDLRDGRVVDVVLSDMSAPWEQTAGHWIRSVSNPYFRMMNTSGTAFRDHAGSMVSLFADLFISFNSPFLFTLLPLLSSSPFASLKSALAEAMAFLFPPGRISAMLP
jgi:23S rRNA U2552 (ribose-2'-O)-methylase RlmE/FtsJ